MGSDSSNGAYFANDIEVMPGSSNTIAVSRKRSNVSPTHGGVAIYDNNIMRPTTTPSHTGSNVFEFTSSNSLIGYNTESTEYGLRRLSVNASVVTNVSVNGGILSGFSQDFVYKNNLIYATNGTVVDMTTSPFVSGQFTNVAGPVVYDDYYNRVCYASTQNGSSLVFKRYNPNTFLQFDSLAITQSSGSARRIITCGNGCYAFNTTDNKVIIIKDAALKVAENELKVTIAVYPNPTNDMVNIKSEFQIINVELSDINGRVIKNNNLNNDKISLNDLQSGIYFAKIRDINDNVKIEKIFKN